MEFKPHLYQQVAIDLIEEQNEVGLFLGCGLGKTAIVLQALCDLKYDYFESRKVLIIAPKRVAQTTWSDELEKWDNFKGKLSLSKVLGTSAQRLSALKADADIYIINRENVVWLVELLGHKWDFDMLIIDELSSFKSPSAKRFRALRKVRPLCKRVVGLTGTPASNGLMDIWSQVYLLDKGYRLGKTMTAYRDKYFSPGGRNGHIIFDWNLKPGAEELIWEKLSDCTLSMKAVDWVTMPKKIDINVVVEMDKADRKRYEQMKKDKVLPLFAEGESISAATAAAVSNKLLQMANGNIYDDVGKSHWIHDCKLEALEEIVEQAQGERILVMYAYTQDCKAIQKKFPKAIVLSTEENIRKFMAMRTPGLDEPIYLAHPASVGHGLNLHSNAHICIWYGLTWSLELYLQAEARLWRQGQQHTVMQYHIITKDTIDEDVIHALKDKAFTQDRLLEALKYRLESEKI